MLTENYSILNTPLTIQFAVVCKLRKIIEKTEFALESFKDTQELIKFVEQKSGAVLIITGLIFTGYIEFLKDLEFSSPLRKVSDLAQLKKA